MAFRRLQEYFFRRSRICIEHEGLHFENGFREIRTTFWFSKVVFTYFARTDDPTRLKVEIESNFLGLSGLLFGQADVTAALLFIGCCSDFVVSGLCRGRRAWDAWQLSHSVSRKLSSAGARLSRNWHCQELVTLNRIWDSIRRVRSALTNGEVPNALNGSHHESIDTGIERMVSIPVDLCFTAFGVGPLVFVRGSMNTDDNARCHVSRATMQWYADNNVRRLDWPAQSPDLNPDDLDGRVRARQARPKSIALLMEWLQEEWRRIPVDVLQTLVGSMPRQGGCCYSRNMWPYEILTGEKGSIAQNHAPRKNGSYHDSTFPKPHSGSNSYLETISRVISLNTKSKTQSGPRYCMHVRQLFSFTSLSVPRLPIAARNTGARATMQVSLEDSMAAGIDGSIPSGATVAERLARSPPTKANRVTGFSQVGIVPDDAVGRRVFSGISRFPPPLHSSAAPYSLQSPSSALKTSTSLLRARRTSDYI
ncbi:hypothetical protein PR048_031127 [Dryococelus australis]|uniref:Uncharacterized protein n=1 Tax=Dryococelus australis TaxID=614101 RepID=A0ABQ9G772_9NEOP|nr:hypothetical protein PR048_031127 [Dryococelus australis]